MACHPCDRSCDHKHCDSGDIMLLICLMTSSQHLFKELCGFMGGSSSQCLVATSDHLTVFGGHWSSGSGDM